MLTIAFPDLSHFEPDVDFHAILAAGIPLFITKAAQGSTYTDPTYADFLARGRSVGLVVGAYAYLLPNEAGADTRNLVTVAHLRPGDLQPVIDAEAPGLTAATVFAAFHDLEADGYRPILYCSLAYWRDVLGSPTAWPLWLAAYRDELPQLPAGVKLFAWQHTDSGSCAGVARRCDMNVFFGTLDELRAYCIPA